MKKQILFIICAWSFVGWLASLQNVQAQVLDDPLIGGTTGTVSGGTFIADGWRVDDQYDSIYWHVPLSDKMAFEYDLIGLDITCPCEGVDCPGDKNELSHMYDYTVGNSDNAYSGGYRDNPYKQFLRKQCLTHRDRKMEILWQILPNWLEDDSAVLSWDPNTTYHFRNEWEHSGGNAIIRTYRNGQLIHTQSLPGQWNPGGLSVRIGASPRRAMQGAHVGTVYSNVMVWNLAVVNIDEVTPDPDMIYVGNEYIKQLVLLSGGPTANWSILQGRPGMNVDGNGLVGGWVPAHSEAGNTYTINIQAQNAFGTDNEQWQVKVKYLGDIDEDLDVDMEDFGKFQACYSGDGVIYDTGCEAMDLQGDGDVDLDDFNIFLPCMNGAHNIPSC